MHFNKQKEKDIKANEPQYKRCGVTHTFRKLENSCRKFC